MAIRAFRRAFSLIEVLVVIGIIGVLLALLVVALSKGRDTAAREQCQNNLRQIGLALHSYENQFKGFPTTIDKTDAKAGKQRSLLIPLLPFLEQESTYQLYNPKFNWWESPNANFINQPIAIFYCPSTPNGQRRDLTGIPLLPAVGPRYCSDYGPLTSVKIKLVTKRRLVDKVADLTGLLFIDNDTGLRPISTCTDGLSNTIAFAEDAARPQLWIGTFYQNKDNAGGAGWADHHIDFGMNGFDPVRKKIGGPCAINCINDNEVYSFHGTGANILLGDGSVRWLRNDIDIRIMAHYITARGNDGNESLD